MGAQPLAKAQEVSLVKKISQDYQRRAQSSRGTGHWKAELAGRGILQAR